MKAVLFAQNLANLGFIMNNTDKMAKKRIKAEIRNF